MRIKARHTNKNQPPNNKQITQIKNKKSDIKRIVLTKMYYLCARNAKH